MRRESAEGASSTTSFESEAHPGCFIACDDGSSALRLLQPTPQGAAAGPPPSARFTLEPSLEE